MFSFEISFIQIRVPFTLSWGLMYLHYIFPCFLFVWLEVIDSLDVLMWLSHWKECVNKTLNRAKIQYTWTGKTGNLDGKWKEHTLRIRPTRLQILTVLFIICLHLSESLNCFSLSLFNYKMDRIPAIKVVLRTSDNVHK